MTNAELELATANKSSQKTSAMTMKALIYHGPGKRAWENKPRPTIQDPGDATVRITTTTICGTDLHILKGDLFVGYRGPHSRPRRDWADRTGRSRCLGISCWRKSDGLLCCGLPEKRLLPEEHVFPWSPWRLDFGQPGKLVTHRFSMREIMKTYDTFGNAAREGGALKVVLTNDGPR